MIPNLLAAANGDLGHSHSVSDALPHLGGMLMVICTLAILWGLCVLTTKLVGLLQPPAKPAPAPAVATAPPTAAPLVPDQTPPEIVAAIAAAVAAVAGPGRRIVSIRSDSSSWAKAGRQSVLSSHRIR